MSNGESVGHDIKNAAERKDGERVQVTEETLIFKTDFNCEIIILQTLLSH